ncbi:UNVERIFIED_CONTAM: hypothetical protein GTU68_050578 [Idotea baltica]|nr:hypothetical protein [Idotea baltica]
MSQDHSAPEGKPAGQHPANHLAGETSPYLLQHLYNPVDWYPWGPEALALAKELDRPIFLSIGYSACHWCHVMERESFENEEIAALMNAKFVSIKVDREERPDIDEIYMAAVQRMTGAGGWPLSMVLTPDLQPYIGGTYFPPKAKYNRPGFDDFLNYAHKLWMEERPRVLANAQQMVDLLKENAEFDASGAVPGAELVKRAATLSLQGYDETHGGFGRSPQYAPKFPHCTQLTFLLRHGKVEGDSDSLRMVRTTLDKMAQGGIYDHVAGGFSRYSVDREWTVPHFEKMLYDNSQLAMLYLEGWQALGDPYYKKVSREIMDYVLLEMTSPEGGFYSTTDADSEGVEGKFFVWTPDEIREICGDDAPVALAWYGVTDQGNFEGHNILTGRTTVNAVAKTTGLSAGDVRDAIRRSRQKLYDAREKRIHPLKDDKVLSSWNGLMLRAFARAAVVLEEPRYLKAAQANADFLLTKMRQDDGSLFRTRRGDVSHLDAYLEDYAFVAQGLLDLYEADFNPRWLEHAIRYHEYAVENFGSAGGSFYATEDDKTVLPVRMKEASESSLPSPLGVALLNGARIALMQGDLEGLARVRAGLASHRKSLDRYPVGYGQLVLLVNFLASAPEEVYVVGERDDPNVQAELKSWQQAWPSSHVLVLIEEAHREKLAELLPATKSKTKTGGKATSYTCHEGVCKLPVVLE